MTLDEAIARHDWASMRTASGTAEAVPDAVRRLLTATTADDVTRGYWSLDNVVVVQGTLTDAAEATADCLVSGLAACTERARPAVLELLVQLASGYGEAEPDRARRIVRSIRPLLPTIERLVHAGSGEEQAHAADLLVLLAESDPAMRVRVVDVARRLQRDAEHEALGRQLLDWLGED